MKRLLIFSIAITIACISRAQGNNIYNTVKKVNLIDWGVSTSSMGNLTPAYGSTIQFSTHYYQTNTYNINAGLKMTWARIELMSQDEEFAIRLNPVQVGYVIQFGQNNSNRSWEIGCSGGTSLTLNSDPMGRTGMFHFFTKIAGVNISPEFRYNINRLSLSATYDLNYGVILDNSKIYQQHTLRLGVGLKIPNN
ncbi:MAG: hypothetical protein MK105_15335 [Crocinitomicaceae bacterium]|nr:hypothetical protein [Crocinitomicaceae bacterium]